MDPVGENENSALKDFVYNYLQIPKTYNKNVDNEHPEIFTPFYNATCSIWLWLCYETALMHSSTFTTGLGGCLKILLNNNKIPFENKSGSVLTVYNLDIDHETDFFKDLYYKYVNAIRTDIKNNAKWVNCPTLYDNTIKIALEKIEDQYP